MTRAMRRLRITGLVQGVGYRYALRDAARRAGLEGWVRNRRDGSVEAVVSGSIEAIDALAAWARQGPPAARVERVAVEPLGADEDTAVDGRFDIRPTV